MKKFAFPIFFILIPLAFAADVKTFSAPDSFPVLQEFFSGSEELKISVYTFNSQNIAYEILKKNANITILIENSPAGGRINQTLLCILSEKADVFLYKGKLRFIHAKYAIKNGDTVLISSENFDYTSYPVDGVGNRGWGAIIEDEKLAKEFEKVFDQDMKTSQKFECKIKINKTPLRPGEKQIANYEIYEKQKVSAVFSPDSLDDLIKLINSSKKYLYIEQFYIRSEWKNRTSPLVKFILDKAREGVEIKIILDGTWFNNVDADSNKKVAEYFNEIARKEKLNLEARVILDPKFDKIHNKGVISDNKVLVSSINWNENSIMDNREAGVIIEGTAYQFYKEKFLEDWGQNRITGLFIENSTLLKIVILALACIILSIIIYLIKRRK